MLSKQTISSRAAIVALLLLLLFLGRAKYKQWQEQREITRQKEMIQAQADAQQKKNDELNQSLQYLNSPDFKERVARDQLGLKKQGEQVYSFTEASTTRTENASQGSSQNFKKWWDYFFAPN